LIKRFDRGQIEAGYTRARMISALTVLRADESVLARTRWSYILLAEEMRRIVAQPKKDAHELFRRMCFNALISNLDDHPRNHALIARDQHWALSPAYDLTPSPVIAQERRDLAMECGDQGRFANAKNILSQHARFLLDKDESHKMVAGMREQMGHWVRHSSRLWRFREGCGNYPRCLHQPWIFSVGGHLFWPSPKNLVSNRPPCIRDSKRPVSQGHVLRRAARRCAIQRASSFGSRDTSMYTNQQQGNPFDKRTSLVRSKDGGTAPKANLGDV